MNSVALEELFHVSKNKPDVVIWVIVISAWEIDIFKEKPALQTGAVEFESLSLCCINFEHSFFLCVSR